MPNTVKESAVHRAAAPPRAEPKPQTTAPPAASRPARPRLPPAGIQVSALAWQLAAACTGILLGAGQVYGGAAPFGLALVIGCAPGYLPAAALGAVVGGLAFFAAGTGRAAGAGRCGGADRPPAAAGAVRVCRGHGLRGAGCGAAGRRLSRPAHAGAGRPACLHRGAGRGLWPCHTYPARRQAPRRLPVAGHAGRLRPAAGPDLVCPRPGAVCAGRAVRRLCRQPGAERRAGRGAGRRRDRRHPFFELCGAGGGAGHAGRGRAVPRRTLALCRRVCRRVCPGCAGRARSFGGGNAGHRRGGRPAFVPAGAAADAAGPVPPARAAGLGPKPDRGGAAAGHHRRHPVGHCRHRQRGVRAPGPAQRREL